MAGITSTKKIKGQPHFLAYITPSEAKTLENLGGQKTMTKEGVPAYPPSNDARGESRGRGPEAGNSGRERGAEQNRSTSPKNNTPDRNKDNDGGQTIQDYYDDQSNLTDTTVITDKDRDDFFAARPDYKAAANEAAAKKRDQQEKARKEKERIDKILAEHRGKTPAAYAYGPPIVNPYGIKFGPKTKKETTASKFRKLVLKDLVDKKRGDKQLSFSAPLNFFNSLKPSRQDVDYTYNSPITTDMMKVDPLNYMDEVNYGITGKNLTDIDRINRAIDQGRSLGNITQTEFEDAFNSQVIPGGGGDGGGQNQLPYIPGPGDTGGEGGEEETTYDYRFGDPNANQALDVTLGRYFNQGGRVPRNMGGIMDVVPRQGYFLGGIGKAIGKIGKAAGKVLKSDIGKAAIAGAMFYYGGGGRMPFTKAFKADGFGGAKLFGEGSFFSKANPLLFSSKDIKGKPTQVFNPFKLSSLFTLGAAAMGPAEQDPSLMATRKDTGLIDPLTKKEGTPASMRENIELAKLEADGDPDKLDALNRAYNNMLFTTKPYENYGIYAAANGGRIGKAEGGLMNLGGMEKDYRAEGGFVPIGKQEKADDVPARLSVNEFVFTADAVRNAGGGDIDKGAEVMENMMKNLENGGRVSEESQGNTGAQDMFSVSERIGEVI